MAFGVTFTFRERWMVEVRATSYLRGPSGPAYVLSGVCYLNLNKPNVILQGCQGKPFGIEAETDRSTTWLVWYIT